MTHSADPAAAVAVTTAPVTVDREELARANRQTLIKLGVVAVAMFGFAYALAPFYEQICEVTGLRDLFRQDGPVAVNTQVDTTRNIAIEFDANTQRLAWTFRPVEGSKTVHPGQLSTVMYEVKNTLDRPVTGQAVPSYAPQRAAQYFSKLECFCFQQQTLAAGEVRQMPVVFVINPNLPDDIPTVTLSYTFFEVAGTQPRAPG